MPPRKKHTGDDGNTRVLGGIHLPKYHPNIRVLGALDEASAAIGLARSLLKNDLYTNILIETQKQLYFIMADIARPLDDKGGEIHLLSTHLDWINSVVATLEMQVKLPSQFILPGDTSESATLSLARTVVRRAEREAVEYLHKKEEKTGPILPWLNRLSHLLFLLEVAEASAAGGRPSLVK